jgi:hypothetical protein
MSYGDTDLEGIMRYWRKDVTVHEFFIDFKEADVGALPLSRWLPFSPNADPVPHWSGHGFCLG